MTSHDASPFTEPMTPAVPAWQIARQAWRVVALSSLLLVAACSSIRLGYNNADTLLLYRLDSYVDLSDEQNALARERVRKLLDWHRSTQLTGYARLVDDAQRRFAAQAAPVATNDVLAFQREMNARLAIVGEQAAPDAALLLTTLAQEQIDRLASKLASETAKARRDMYKAQAGNNTDDRVKRYAERAETWLGPLSRAQLEIVRSALASRPDGSEFWMAERERRQQLFLALARRIHDERPSQEVATGWVRAYFAELAEPRDAERRAAIGTWRRANADLMAQLVNSATPEQRVALGKKLRGYSQDFSALANEAGNGRG